MWPRPRGAATRSASVAFSPCASSSSAWLVYRLISGQGMFPSVPFPPGADRWLPAVAIILLLGAVMLGPMLGSGPFPAPPHPPR